MVTKEAVEKKRKAYSSLHAKHERHAVFLSRGITRQQTTLDELGSAGGRKRLYEKLFGPLVKDPQFMEILIQNRHKYLHRFGYTIELVKANGDKLGTFWDLGNRDLEGVAQSYLERLHYRKGTMIESNQLNNDGMLLKLNKANVHQLNKGVIERVNVTITFTQG